MDNTQTQAPAPPARGPIDFQALDAATIAALMFPDRKPVRTTAVFLADQIAEIEALAKVRRNRHNSPDSRKWTATLQAVIDLGLSEARRLGYLPGAPAEEAATPA